MTDATIRDVYKRMILRGVWWISLLTILTVGAVLFLYYLPMDQGSFLVCWLSSCWLLCAAMIKIELMIRRVWPRRELSGRQ
jgi:hypothetical protein